MTFVARLSVLHVDIRQVGECGEARLGDEVIRNVLRVLSPQLIQTGRRGRRM